MLDEQQEAPDAEAADDGDAGDSGAATATEARAEPVEAATPADAPEADADEDDGDQAVDPVVQEYIGQDTTVMHDEPGTDEHGVPTEFRTPPGIPSGLDPGSLEDRDHPPRP